MNDEKLMNGKIRVVENIGPYSEEAFGLDGSVLTVIDGMLEDIEEFMWTKDFDIPFSDLDDINKFFATADEYQTVFELVEE